MRTIKLLQVAPLAQPQPKEKKETNMVTRNDGGSGRAASSHNYDIRAVLEALGITINGNRLEECPFCGDGRTCKVHDEHIYCQHAEGVFVERMEYGVCA